MKAGPIQLAPAYPAFSYPVGMARTAILDTDYIFNDLIERVRGSHSRFATGLALGGARAFAAAHVLDELYYRADNLGNRHKWDKMARQSEREGWPTAPAVFRDVFETEYLAKITFVDVTGMFVDAPAAKEVWRRGKSDAPTGQLAVLLSRTRPVVYSHDHSLFESRLAPRPQHFQAVMAAGRDMESADASMKGVTYIGVGVVWAADGVARSTAGVLRVPELATRIMLAGASLWLLFGARRRAKVVQALIAVGRFLEEELEKAAVGRHLLTSSAAQVAPDDSIECRISEVLATNSETSLLTQEIQDQLATAVEVSEELPSLDQIRAVLKSAPCFVESPRHRYRLGRTY